MSDHRFVHSWIRSTFDKSHHELVNNKYNSQLLGLLDLDNPAPCFKQIGIVTAMLQNIALCRYQAKLLRKYCAEPQRYLSLDCDTIVLTVRCTKKDIDSLLKPIGADNKPRFFKTGTAAKPADFTVFPTSTYELNGGDSRTRYGKPYYSHGFKLEFNSASDKSVLLFLEGKPKKTGKYSLRLDFNPNKLTGDEIKQALLHIQKRIGGEYRYKQLFSKAKVTRVDFGILLPGISSVFVHAFRDNAKPIISSCIPLDEQQVVETTYLGSKANASHCIVYEKLLKESKGYPEVRILLNQLAITTRIEYKHLTNREEHSSDLKDLSTFPTRLQQVRIISPKYFYLLSDYMLQKMLTDKRQESVKQMRKRIRPVLKHDGKKLTVRKFDLAWLEREQKALAGKLVGLILDPKG